LTLRNIRLGCAAVADPLDDRLRNRASASVDWPPDRLPKGAEPAGMRQRLRRFCAGSLSRRVACVHHRQRPQHLLEKRRIEPQLPSRILRNRAAHVLRAENLPEDVVAARSVQQFLGNIAAARCSSVATPSTTAIGLGGGGATGATPWLAVAAVADGAAAGVGVAAAAASPMPSFSRILLDIPLRSPAVIGETVPPPPHRR
jgi:hypothetical protein